MARKSICARLSERSGWPVSLCLAVICLIRPNFTQGAGTTWDPAASVVSATGVIERYHRDLGNLTAAQEAFAAAALRSRPESIGYHQSSCYPIRSHYPDVAYSGMALEILGIMEYSWEVQVDGLGFRAPPADYGEGGSNDLDVYIQDLPAGIGGFAAFSSYIDETPEADAASFIVLSSALTQANLRGSATHEFNHCCQNAVDYWEHMTFKENTATWVMDRVYDDENAYFFFLRAYQRHPHWAIHKFSTDTTYQYGECMLLHFLSEYYSGRDGSIIARWWEECAQNEQFNEPDYMDVLRDLIPRETRGRDTMADALREYGIWRYACAGRDDGRHFHDGGAWPDGALVAIDTEVDAASLPYLGGPVEPPADFGYSFWRLLGQPGDDWLAIEFDGDPAVGWEVTLIQRTAGPTYLARSMTVTAGRGLLLVGPETLARNEETVLAVLNLSNPEFDPDGNEDNPRGFTVSINGVRRGDSLSIWSDRPMHGGGDILNLNLDIEHSGGNMTTQLYVVLELYGEYLFLSAEPAYPAFTSATNWFELPLPPDFSVSIPLLALELPALPEPLHLTWHAALLQGADLITYASSKDTLIPQRR
ncbi:hypothetical protein JW905_11635 [bacterium]|nr:hypothetical protein [candidate division CSSED10-310 bacterium]